MATFEGVDRKSRERTLKVRLPGAEKDWPVVIRATSAFEDADAVAFAIAAAKKAGAEPKHGDPVFDPARWAHIVASAYLDVDSPEGARRPAFPGGAKQVLEKLSTESIAYLFQEQQRHQEEVSPGFKARTTDDLIEIIKRTASEGGDFFFGGLSPSTQSHSARFMAVLLVSSPDTTWRSGSRTAASTASSSNSPTSSPSSKPQPTRSRKPPAKGT